jgi:hypothetical protein
MVPVMKEEAGHVSVYPFDYKAFERIAEGGLACETPSPNALANTSIAGGNKWPPDSYRIQ